MSPVSFVLAFRLSFLASSKSSEDGMQSLTKFRACCFVGEFDPPFDCSRHHAAQGMPGWVSRDPYVRCTRHAIKKGHQRSHRALWGQMYRQIHGGILCAWRLAWTGSGMKKKTGKKKKKTIACRIGGSCICKTRRNFTVCPLKNSGLRYQAKTACSFRCLLDGCEKACRWAGAHIESLHFLFFNAYAR